MKFIDKIKQGSVLMILLIILFFFIGVMNQETFNVYRWTNDARFYFNGIIIVSLLFISVYFVDK